MKSRILKQLTTTAIKESMKQQNTEINNNCVGFLCLGLFHNFFLFLCCCWNRV